MHVRRHTRNQPFQIAKSRSAKHIHQLQHPPAEGQFPERAHRLRRGEQPFGRHRAPIGKRAAVPGNRKSEVRVVVGYLETVAEALDLRLAQHPAEGAVAAPRRVRPGIELHVFEFRQPAAEAIAGPQDIDESLRVRCEKRLPELRPDSLGGQFGQARRHVGDKRDGGPVHREALELGRETRQPEHAQGIFAECLAHVAKDPVRQVPLPAEGVDQPALGVLRHGVHREVPARQVLFQGNPGPGLHGKTPMARRGFPLGAGQRVFLVGLGVQEDGEGPADPAVALAQQFFGRTAHDDPVVHLFGAAPEKFVANRAAHQVDFHGNRF